MSGGAAQSRGERRVLVACRVMEPELEQARDGDQGVEVRYLEQGLHRTPQRMAAAIQEHIDEVASHAARIVVGYGLCSNGIVGVTARGQGLFVPHCHDCISFFLGSPQIYKKAFEARPGTYYLTPGWIAEKKDPLGIVEEEYIPRYGRETAMWAMEEELKHYTHIALINTGVGDLQPLRDRALENARVLNKEYEEIRGSLDFFEKLLRGPYDPEDFFFVQAGQRITQEVYLQQQLVSK